MPTNTEALLNCSSILGWYSQTQDKRIEPITVLMTTKQSTLYYCCVLFNFSNSEQDKVLSSYDVHSNT